MVRTRSARALACARSGRSGQSTTNSSPPRRATVSFSRTICVSRRAASISNWSPPAWPMESLTILKRSRSQNSTASWAPRRRVAIRLSARRDSSRLRLASPVSASWLAWNDSCRAEASRSRARATSSRQRSSAVWVSSSSSSGPPNTSRLPVLPAASARNVALHAGRSDTSTSGGWTTVCSPAAMRTACAPETSAASRTTLRSTVGTGSPVAMRSSTCACSRSNAETRCSSCCVSRNVCRSLSRSLRALRYWRATFAVTHHSSTVPTVRAARISTIWMRRPRSSCSSLTRPSRCTPAEDDSDIRRVCSVSARALGSSMSAEGLRCSSGMTPAGNCSTAASMSRRAAWYSGDAACPAVTPSAPTTSRRWPSRARAT